MHTGINRHGESLLLQRLEAIGQSLQASRHALALIGLGSVGTELERIDQHSDLDFFAIVEEGYKARYIEHLDWLSDIAPVAYRFQNTVDGYKLLYADGIFCEFAVFELGELEGIPFSAGRMVWKKPHVADSIAVPVRKSSSGSKLDIEWQLGEALTNLLIGLKRFRRGEKLSGSRFVQSYALDRLLDLAGLIEDEQPYFKDKFGNDRRFERRFPRVSERLPEFVQGYERTPESALAILEFLEQHFEVNVAIAREIRTLVNEGQHEHV
jgi:lincosamide nucleotidyltransferase B/F